MYESRNEFGIPFPGLDVQPDQEPDDDGMNESRGVINGCAMGVLGWIVITTLAVLACAVVVL